MYIPKLKGTYVESRVPTTTSFFFWKDVVDMMRNAGHHKDADTLNDAVELVGMYQRAFMAESE